MVLYVYKRCRRKSGRAVIKPGPIEGLSLANGISLSSVITGVTGNRYESSPIPVHQFITLVRKVGSHFRVIIKIARKRIHAVINQYRDYAFLLPRRPSTRSWTTRSVRRVYLKRMYLSIRSEKNIVIILIRISTRASLVDGERIFCNTERKIRVAPPQDKVS